MIHTNYLKMSLLKPLKRLGFFLFVLLWDYIQNYYFILLLNIINIDRRNLFDVYIVRIKVVTHFFVFNPFRTWDRFRLLRSPNASINGNAIRETNTLQFVFICSLSVRWRIKSRLSLPNLSNGFWFFVSVSSVIRTEWEIMECLYNL